ncbi:MAG TPA: S-layer homology domain-containing protein [Symbiobacteriaceae bacterium]|nr:S-layer homology domain-containing protein [Symbiobacteriaceae bacterium]
MGSTRRLACFLALCLLLAALAPSAGAADSPGAMGRPSLGWKQVSPRPIGESLYAVAYGAGLWVAASDHAIYTSKDGLKWSPAAAFTTQFVRDIRVVHTGNQFHVTNGSDGLKSADGVRWEPESGTAAFACGSLCASLPGQERWITATGLDGTLAVGAANGEVRATRDGGRTWLTYRQATGEAVAGLVRLPAGFVLLEQDGDVWLHRGEASWEAVATLDGARWRGLAAGPGGLMAVGEGGAIARSPDGRTWERVTRGPAHKWTSVAFGAGRFVAVGHFGTSMLYTSENGVDWSFQKVIMPPRTEFRVAYAGERFWLYDQWGIRESSPDGRTWTEVDDTLRRSTLLGTTGALLVKTPGGLMISRAGEPLQPLQSPGLAVITAGIVTKDRYLLGGESGQIAVSTDGKSWSQTRVPDSCAIGGIVAGKGEYLAHCRMGGPVFRSADGRTWSSVANSSALQLFYAGDRYYALAFSGRVGVSENGLTWDWRHQSPDLTGMGFGQGRVVAVGALGTVLVSDGPTPAPLAGAEAPDLYASTVKADATEGVGQLLLVTVTLKDRAGRPLAGRPVALFMEMAPSSALVVKTDRNGLAYFSMTRLDGGKAEVYRAVDLASGTWLTSQVTLNRRYCGARFADVTASHPECQVIEGVAARGQLSALADGKFQGEGTLTRAELLNIARAAGYSGKLHGEVDNTPATRAELIEALVAISGLGPITDSAFLPYSDLNAADWYTPYVRRAQFQGYIGKDRIAPVFPENQPLQAEKPVTRLEVGRALADLHYQVTLNLSGFSQNQ